MGRFLETARPTSYVLSPSSYSARIRLNPPVLAWGPIETCGRIMAGKLANTKSIKKRRRGWYHFHTSVSISGPYE